MKTALEPVVMPMTRKRVLLLGVAALLSVSALLAIVILLVGRFGSVEGRILASTALTAGYGLVALPAVVLLDRQRARLLALSAAAATAVAAALALALVWSRSGSDAFGRSVGSATIVVLALAQVSATVGLRGGRDRLFVASCGTAAVVAAFAVGLVWANPDGGAAPRFLAALFVLDLLLVALQPLVARTRGGEAVRRITVVTSSGEEVEVEVDGADLATAAARAIRTVEHRGGSVVELKVEPAGPRAARRRVGAS